MQTATGASIRDRVAALRDRFLSDLPRRVRAIAFEMARVGSDEGSLGRLERLFHTVAGTAGTFGLVAVAALAREGEEICTAPVDAEGLAYLGTILSELEHQTATLSARDQAA